MFHTLWTNSSCHGYHSLEFPVSWVIKFPTVILFCWFVCNSLFPWFALLEDISQAVWISSGFCIFYTRKKMGCFSQGVWISRRKRGVKPHQAALWAPDSAVGAQLVEVCAGGNPQPCRAAHSNTCTASALQCFPYHAVCPDWRSVENNFVLPRSLVLGTARVSGQPAAIHRVSAGIWWALRVSVPGPTITKGLHLVDGAWGPLQHCSASALQTVQIFGLIP